MKHLVKRTFWYHTLGLGSLLVLLVFWWYAVFGVVTEKNQGDVYRILYVHVPSAAVAFLLSFILMIQGLWNLKKPHGNLILWGKALAELGLLFTILTLISGSFWGRPTWGVWWTWDSRLTTTFLLALLYLGYLILWGCLESKERRVKVCAILAVLIAAPIPCLSF